MVGEAPPPQAEGRSEAPQAESRRAERRDEVVIRVPTLGRLLRALMPEETAQHLLAAQREQLLALRSLIDAAVKRLDEAQHEDRSQPPRRVEIRVE